VSVSPLTLFHVSEEEGIERFEPRAAVVSGGTVEPLGPVEPAGAAEPLDPVESAEPVVWAIDECAGYFVSHVPVVPTSLHIIDDPIGALATQGVELRILPSLWPLRDAVIASSLQFSIIRMRNAQPRD
jgi:hypothetical protein